MHPMITLWSASEPELSPVLLAMAAAVERNAQAQHHMLLTYVPTIAQVINIPIFQIMHSELLVLKMHLKN